MELEAWREIIELEKTKQGIVIALTPPEDDESGIREKVFDELSIDLKAEDRLNTLLEFMNRKLKKDDLANSWDKFNSFEEYQKGNKLYTNILQNLIRITTNWLKKA